LGVLGEKFAKAIKTVFPGRSLAAQPVLGDPQSDWLDVTGPHSTDLLRAD
jgi:hypothetical protein